MNDTIPSRTGDYRQPAPAQRANAACPWCHREDQMWLRRYPNARTGVECRACGCGSIQWPTNPTINK